MLRQLLWIEVVLKGGIGLVLLLAPIRAAMVAGFPSSGSSSGRGCLARRLLGIAVALLLQGSFPAVKTITPAGLLVINLAGIAGLVAAQVLGQGCQTRRGKVLAWLVAGAIALLCIFEIAFA